MNALLEGREDAWVLELDPARDALLDAVRVADERASGRRWSCSAVVGRACARLVDSRDTKTFIRGVVGSQRKCRRGGALAALGLVLEHAFGRPPGGRSIVEVDEEDKAHVDAAVEHVSDVVGFRVDDATAVGVALLLELEKIALDIQARGCEACGRVAFCECSGHYGP